MGVRAGVVVCVTSFLLGALFTNWIADSLTLWKSPITDEHLWTAASYYSILANGPTEALYFLAGVVLLGATTILWSLGDGEAGNLMFDGGSIFLFCTTALMYLFSVLPSVFNKFAALPPHQLKDPFPRTLRIATLDLASSNLICSVALTGVLALQAGRSWAERADDDDDEEEEQQETAADTSEAEDSKGGRSRGRTPDVVNPLLKQRVQTTAAS